MLAPAVNEATGTAAGPLAGLNTIDLSGLLRTDLLGLPKIDMTISIPEILTQQIIPVATMIGLPALLSLWAYRRGIALTRRDHMILQFSGFIAVYIEGQDDSSADDDDRILARGRRVGHVGMSAGTCLQ